jgi:hypothetical protein
LLLRMITPLAFRLDRGNKYSGSDFDLNIRSHAVTVPNKEMHCL